MGKKIYLALYKTDKRLVEFEKTIDEDALVTDEVKDFADIRTPVRDKKGVVTGYEKTGENEEKKKVPLHVYDEFRYSEECRNRAATKWLYYKGNSPFSWDNLSADGIHVLSEDEKKAELESIKAAEKAKAELATKGEVK